MEELKTVDFSLLGYFSLRIEITSNYHLGTRGVGGVLKIRTSDSKNKTASFCYLFFLSTFSKNLRLTLLILEADWLWYLKTVIELRQRMLDNRKRKDEVWGLY